jgi:hypothetical protein
MRLSDKRIRQFVEDCYALTGLSPIFVVESHGNQFLVAGTTPFGNKLATGTYSTSDEARREARRFNKMRPPVSGGE